MTTLLAVGWPAIIAALVLGYAAGAIPFGLILTKFAGLGDVRAIGSGNIGATNVLRTGNKPAALATLLLDSGKGAIAVLLARQFGGETAAILAGSAVAGSPLATDDGFTTAFLVCAFGSALAAAIALVIPRRTTSAPFATLPPKTRK